MRKILLILILAHLCLSRTGAQELGANYNENIGQPITEIRMLRNAGISWVRGFINVHSEFLKVEDNVIVGVDEDAIRTSSLSRQFMAAKASLGDGVKFMLSLKIPFGEDEGLVPEVGSEACEHIFTAVRMLLGSFDMGRNISLLVMGNEPMWENWNAGLQDDDADDYKAFLNEFADRLAQWKSEEGWTFEVFAGSLNRISEVQRPTIQAVMDVVNENPNVDGLDLHLHCRNINQAEDDLRLARKKYGVTKKLICTEFSMVRNLEGEGGTDHRTENLGNWGTSHGYSATMKLWEYLDMAVKNGFTVWEFNSWTDFPEFAAELPVSRQTGYEELFNASGVTEIGQGDDLYYVYITDRRKIGDVAPIERVRASIRQIIFHQRRLDVLRNYEDSIYRHALDSDLAEIRIN